MKKLILFFFLLSTFSAFSKPLFINLDQTLKTTSFAEEVIIKEYMLTGDSLITGFKIDLLRFPDSTFTVTKIHPYEYIYPLSLKSEHQGDICHWPKKGDSVLVVLDSTGALSFFGEFKRDNYKLFTPFFTGSVTTFISQRVYLQLNSTAPGGAPPYFYPSGLFLSKYDIIHKRIVKTMTDTQFHVADIIKIPQILYSPDGFTSNDSIDVVADFLLKHPNLMVEIGCYTNSKSNPEGDQATCDRRAKWCIEYLINKKHIPSKRLKSKGYGYESNLHPLIFSGDIAKAQSKNERERLLAINERTELMVLKIR